MHKTIGTSQRQRHLIQIKIVASYSTHMNWATKGRVAKGPITRIGIESDRDFFILEDLPFPTVSIFFDHLNIYNHIHNHNHNDTTMQSMY